MECFSFVFFVVWSCVIWGQFFQWWLFLREREFRGVEVVSCWVQFRRVLRGLVYGRFLISIGKASEVVVIDIIGFVGSRVGLGFKVFEFQKLFFYWWFFVRFLEQNSRVFWVQERSMGSWYSGIQGVRVFIFFCVVWCQVQVRRLFLFRLEFW